MEILTHLFSILSLLFVFAAFSILYWTIKNGIGPMPTSSKVLAAVLKVPININPGVIYELGSGWGSVAIALAKKYPEHRVEAFEISLVPYLFSRLRLYFSPLDNLQFHRQNIFDVKLQDAVLVYCYLYPLAMQRLEKKFENELFNGCLVMSNTFAIRSWQPIAVYPVEDLYNTHIYVYEAPGIQISFGDEV